MHIKKVCVLKINEVIEKIKTLVYNRSFLKKDDINKMPKLYFSHELPSGKATILLFGEEASNYLFLYEELYNKMKIEQRGITLKTFKEATQMLLFTNEFDKNKIDDKIKNFKQEETIYIKKIHGVQISELKLTFGKFIIIHRNHIKKYIVENTKKIEDFESFEKTIYDNIESNVKNSNYFYLAIEYTVRDSNYAKILFENDMRVFMNMLRFMFGVKHHRVYISDKNEDDSFVEDVQIIKNKYLLKSFFVNRKDLALTVSKNLYEEDGSKVLWNIASKSNLNDLENRIIKSINWIGMSINEDDASIATTLIAFGFEALLKSNKSSVISQSIQGHISESVAFIIGKSYKDRLEIEKTFKNLYSFRSKVAHGYTASDDGNYSSYFSMFSKTIKELTTNKVYMNIKNVDELFKLLKRQKYSSPLIDQL